MTWAEYLRWLAAEHGSLVAVAVKLAGARHSAESVERALRRLRTKKNCDGGDWGRRALRAFGLPRETVERVRWMGQYHSVFTDLPVDLCLDQLRAWHRPPLSESPARVWLELGLATCALRQADLGGAEWHLAAAARVPSASVEARLELGLVRAFVDSKRGREPDLEVLEPLVREARDAALTARWLDQRAYQSKSDARKLYEQIPEDGPFAACKRHTGLAYACWKEGDLARARAHAERAVTEAGDGGYTRLRITALGLLANILGSDDVRARAVRAARHLQDPELEARVSRGRRSAPAESPRPPPRGAGASRRSASPAPRTSSTRRPP
jgi:hypothetical protein